MKKKETIHMTEKYKSDQHIEQFESLCDKKFRSYLGSDECFPQVEMYIHPDYNLEDVRSKLDEAIQEHVTLKKLEIEVAIREDYREVLVTFDLRLFDDQHLHQLMALLKQEGSDVVTEAIPALFV